MTAPTAPAPSRPLVAAAVLFVLLVSLGGVATLTAQALRSTTQRSTTIEPMANRLTVNNDIGDVLLAPSPDGSVHVLTEARYGLQAPQMVQDSTPLGVMLQARCADVLASECSVDYTIQVPPSFAVAVEAGSGDVIAQRLSGDLILQLGAANASVIDHTGSLTVHSGTGDVNAIDLRSDVVQVATGNGEVQLDMQTPPSTVRVATATGSIDVRVPAEETYRVSADGNTDDQRIGVRTDPSATRTITVTSDSGEIRVAPSRPDTFDGDGPQVVRIPPYPPVPPVAPRVLPDPFGDSSDGDGG
jgi:Putative adhesin